MHVMISRMVASITLGVSAVAMPTSTLAQSHVPMAGAAARATAHPLAMVPAQRAPSRMSGTFRPHTGALAISEAHRHRGSGAPIWWWGYPPQAPAYDVNAYPPAYESPVYDNPLGEEVPNRPATDHRPYPYCRTDSQKVASTNGGEHTVNITRCY